MQISENSFVILNNEFTYVEIAKRIGIGQEDV